LNLINNLAKNSEHKPEEIAAGIRAYEGKTGSANFGGMGAFAANLSSVAGMSMSEVGTMLGGLKAQFGMSNEGTQKAALSLWHQGKAGTVELKDTQSISEALGFSRSAGKGDVLHGIGLEMGAVQLAQKGLGGTNANEAVTGVRRLEEYMLNSPALLQSKIGGGAITSRSPTGNV